MAISYRMLKWGLLVLAVHAEKWPTSRSPITAPLQVHPANPIYFLDPASGKAVHLTGHQSFVDLQDHQFDVEFTYNHQRELDWNWYIGFLKDNNFNQIRSWTVWTVGSIPSAKDQNKCLDPPQYYRNGSQLALDDRPKFDLGVYSNEYLDRLSSRMASLEEIGIYVSFMMFEVYSFVNYFNTPYPDSSWGGCFFNKENNQQNMDCDPNGDGEGMEFFYSTPNSPLRALQEDWIARVVRSVGKANNVYYEVANELGNIDFQNDMMDVIRREEKAQNFPKHLILLSPGGRVHGGDWKALPQDVIVNSSRADIFALDRSWPDVGDDPLPNSHGRPGIWDGDHMWVNDYVHYTYPWVAFTRGYHYTLYDHPFEEPDAENSLWKMMRLNIGAVNHVSASFQDLSMMQPDTDQCSTKHCLIDLVHGEYLVFQPQNGTSFSVSISSGGDYSFQWWNCLNGTWDESGTFNQADPGSRSFRPSFDTEAVLHFVMLPSKVNLYN